VSPSAHTQCKGKSTLLDILAARKTVGRLTGRVCVNGAPRTSDFVRRISYVPQEDNFMPAMTVQETCALHAALKLPRDRNVRFGLWRGLLVRHAQVDAASASMIGWHLVS
jgi:ABC-type multidrug transport system ATPase subunit